MGISSSKKKLLIAILSVCGVFIAGLVAVVIVMAAATQRVKTTVSINYVAEGMFGSAKASYKIGDNGNWIDMVRSDNGTSEPLDLVDDFGVTISPEQEIELTVSENYVIFKYTFINTGDSDFFGTLTYTDTGVTDANITVTYSTNGTSYSTTKSALTVPHGSETAEYNYFIKVAVKNIALSATFTGNFNWSITDSNVNYSVLDETQKTAQVTGLLDSNATEAKINRTTIINGEEYTVTSIANNAFSNKNKLTTVNIPETITSIGNYAFEGCTNLTEVEIPANTTNIGYAAFGGCSGLTSIAVDANNSVYESNGANAIIEKSTNTLIAGCKNTVIPNTVTKIAGRAFYNLGSAVTIDVPNSVEYIGDYAFYNTTINALPDNLAYFGVKSINECATYTRDDNNSGYYGSASNPFLYLCEYRNTNAFEINPNCKFIEDNAVRALETSSEIIIPASIIEIGSDAFRNNKITFEEGSQLTTILDYAFGGCNVNFAPSLLPNLKEIGIKAFYDTNYTRLIIPQSVETIYSDAFGGLASTSFELIMQSAKPPAIVNPIDKDRHQEETVLTDLGVDNIKIYVPEGSLAAYQAAPVWEKYADRIVEITAVEGAKVAVGDFGIVTHADGTATIEAYLGNGTGELVIPSKAVDRYGYTYTITEIGDIASVNSLIGSGLTSLYIPNTIKVIGALTFIGNQNLTSLIFEEGSQLQYIAEEAFGNCALTEVTIPASVEYIEARAFDNNPLNVVYMQGTTPPKFVDGSANGVSYIEWPPLGDKVEVIYVPEGSLAAYQNEPTWSMYKQYLTENTPVTEKVTIGDYVYQTYTNGTASLFQYNGSEAKVVIPNKISLYNYEYKVTAIDNDAFANNKLYSVVIPEGITKIGSGAFRECINLTSINLPQSLTYLGEYALAGTGLTKVTIPKNVDFIEGYLFDGCKNLTTIICEPEIAPRTYALGNVFFSDNSVVTTPGVTEARVNIIGNKTYGFVYPELNGKIAAVAAFDAVDTVDVKGITYKLQKDYTAIITGYTSTSGNVVIPEQLQYNGEAYTVVGIEGKALSYSENITSLTLPNTITKIGGGAFGSSQIASIILSNNITQIGESTFADNTSLTNIVIPEGVTEISGYAFGGCTNLTSVTLPSTLTSIKDSAFKDCTKLENVKLPIGLKTIDAYTFNGTAITNIEIPHTVSSIGESAFYNCKNLQFISLQDTYKVIIPTLGKNAFAAGVPIYMSTNVYNALNGDVNWNIYNLTEMKVLDTISVNDVKYDLYQNYVAHVMGYSGSSTSLTIPQQVEFKGEMYTVTQIADDAFNGSKVEKIILPDSIYVIGVGAFKASALTTISLSKNLRYIFESAFNGTQLTSITIPTSVISILQYAFYNCTQLKQVKFVEYNNYNKSVAIGNYAFMDCQGLFGVEFNANTICKLGDSAFANCTSLTSITLPEKTGAIRDNAFKGCTALTKVYLKSVVSPTVTSTSFDSGVEIFVPAGCGTNYKNSDWGQYHISENSIKDYQENYITYRLYDDGTAAIVEVDPSALTGDTIYIPDTIEWEGMTFEVVGMVNIEEAALFNNISANGYHVRLPKHLNRISDHAFVGTSLGTVIIPEAVQYIGGSAFQDCSNLMFIEFKGAVPISNDYINIFKNCDSMRRIIVPKGMLEDYKTFIENCGLNSNLVYEASY